MPAPTSPSVAITVPAPTLRLGPDEELSLRHLREHLGGYDAYALTAGPGTLPGLRRLGFERKRLAGHRAYSRLLLSAEFYEAFAGYEFVLVYQLDSLVFRDELAAWCERGFDFVGAPWLRRDTDGRPHFMGAGNGGFSLRRVASCLRVLEARTALTRLRSAAGLSVALAARGARRMSQGARAVRGALGTPYLFEDKFWSLEAPLLDPSFRVAPAEVAVSFAFEAEPRFCFEQNARRLPFGCHKWRAHDPDFWEPHLLTGVDA